jgi:hypothetical protein
VGYLFDSVDDVVADAEKIRNRPYGVIEVVDEQLVAIHLRPWPKLISSIEAKWADGWGKKRSRKNQAQVFFSQPMAHRNYLTISYIVSTLRTSMTTVTLSMAVLDYVAYLKRSDAILAEVSNSRISDRLMQRLGFERHLLESRKRHWIKRFYGQYPENGLLQAKLGIQFDNHPAHAIAST